MRIVFIGSGALSVATVKHLIDQKHEVIIIEQDKERAGELTDSLDCGVLHGDGSKPAILKEADPEHTDVLFCLTENDQTNIIAGLVGRSLGFGRVVTKIEDEEFEHICSELGLEDVIIPTRTISRYLSDMVMGRDILELSSIIKGDARLFTFVARDDDAGEVRSLDIPGDARIISFYRGKEFFPADPGSRLKKGDEVVVLARSEHLETLKERWAPKRNSTDDGDADKEGNGKR